MEKTRKIGVGIMRNTININRLHGDQMLELAHKDFRAAIITA